MLLALFAAGAVGSLLFLPGEPVSLRYDFVGFRTPLNVYGAVVCSVLAVLVYWLVFAEDEDEEEGSDEREAV